MFGSILAAAIAYGAQQAGQWIQSPAGRNFIQTCGSVALTELLRKSNLD